MKHSDTHCSLGDSSAISHLNSNWAQIPMSFDDVTYTFTQRAPGNHGLTVMHELTHHWCFHSPFGSAIGALYTGISATAGNSLLCESDDEKWRIANGNIALAYATELWRPITEGLGLFAEFDALTFPETPVISDVIGWTSMFYLKHESVINAPDSLEVFQNYLSNARTSDLNIRRKADLLVQSILPSRGKGYLPGYLLVKAIQYDMFRHIGDQNLLDSDFLLMTLRMLFYESPDMAKVLSEAISDSASPDIVAHKVAKSLGSIFGLIGNEPQKVRSIVQDLAKFEKTHTSKMGLDAYRELQPLIDWCGSVGISKQQSAFVFTRDLMCVGTSEAVVEVTDDGRVLVYDKSRDDNFSIPNIALPALSTASACKGEGTIGVFVSRVKNRIVFAVTVHDSVVGIYPNDEAVQAELADYNLSYNFLLEITSQWDSNIENALRDSIPEILVSDLKERLPNYVDEIYKQICIFLPEDTDARNITFEKMSENGIFSLLPQKDALERVTELAALSLLPQMLVPTDLAEKYLSDKGFSLDRARESNRFASEQFGIKLIDENDGFLATKY